MKPASHPLKKTLPLAVLAALSQSLWAAEAPVLREIVVTTQKREQNLLEVPVSVSGYTGEFLETLGVNEFDELADITPGLIVQEQSANNPAFVIRGITSDDGAAQISPRVSVYYNDVDVSRPQMSLFELFDIMQIEVARGPQSTIFGTAAAIGAVAVRSNRPEPGTDAAITVSAGNYNAVETNGYVNGGDERLAGRLAFSYRNRDGYSENIAGDPGSQSALEQPDLNGLDRRAVRGSLRYSPQRNLVFDLIVNYEEDRDPGTGFKSGIVAPTGGSTDPFSFLEIGDAGPRAKQVLGDDRLGVNRDIVDINLSGSWRPDNDNIFSFVSSYRDFDNLEIFDADGSQAQWLQFSDAAEGDQWSHELRWTFRNRLLYGLVGFNYFHEDGTQRFNFLTDEGVFLACSTHLDPDLPCANADGSINSITAAQGLPNRYYSGYLANSGDNDSWSLFTDITFRPTPKLDVTAGLRYVREDKTSGAAVLLPDATLTGAPLLPAAVNTDGSWVFDDADFDAFIPRVNMLYRYSDDLSFYATVSKGRRSPVLDVDTAVNASGMPTPYSRLIPQEKIVNYEAGIKAMLLDSRMSLYTAFYHQDYSNFQVTIYDANAQAQPSNAGSATNDGFELESRLWLTDTLELFGTLAYIDASIDDKPANGIFAGNRFRLQPKWTSSLGAEYTRYIGNDLQFFARPSWTYRSDVYFQVPNDPVAGLPVSQPDVSLFNLRTGVNSIDGHWTLAAFLSNAFDKQYLIDAGNIGAIFGTPTFIAGPPRFYGLEFTYRL